MIFEAGWLTGLFRGQQKVCFLATSDRLELPSDVHGVLREPFSIQDPNKSRIEAILTEWGKVTVTWWTHKIKGLHVNDFIMAAKTDQLFKSRK